MDFEPFTFVTPTTQHGEHQLFGDFLDLTSGKAADLDIQLVASLRKQHPELIVTSTPANNVNLLQFARAGFATYEQDTSSDSTYRWRGYAPSPQRGGPGVLAESIFFAKYHYHWSNEDFILYTVVIGYTTLQYVLKEPRDGETTLSHSSLTDLLILTIGNWLTADKQFIYVYDGYWQLSKDLWEQVHKSSWDKVILDAEMKKVLTEVSTKFFDNKDIYEDLGVPWKRGLIFYGPPGNGKTISIKALMHTLDQHSPSIPALYVKAAPSTYAIRNVFLMARRMAPCVLILEDIETIVTWQTRSYFFNEVDGLENNDGILMIASTNYLDRLDPGLTKRPSRFDRKYLFPLPSCDERSLYCEFWRKKLKNKPSIDFPEKLCNAIAGITDGFSFAYMQEAFVATLLEIARHQTSDENKKQPEPEDADLDRYELWRVMKEQVKILRDDMGSSTTMSESTRDRHASGVLGMVNGDPTTPSESSECQLQDLHQASLRRSATRGGMLGSCLDRTVGLPILSKEMAAKDAAPMVGLDRQPRS